MDQATVVRTTLQEHIVARVKVKLESMDKAGLPIILDSLPSTDIEIRKYGEANVVIDIIDDTICLTTN